jgi:hypothetical protein
MKQQLTMTMKTTTLAALLVLPLAVSTAWAQDGTTQAIKVSGFGTGALTWTNNGDALFARPYQAGGAGTRPRTGVDSNVGLQVDARINDWLSLTGQGVVRKLETDAYGATGTLAFAKARVSDTLAVRVGRVPLAAFLVSDYRNVGYANTMLRPSQEVYSQVPNDSLDGVDVEWRNAIGSATLTTQVAYGRSAAKLAGVSDTFRNTRVVNVVLEQGPVIFRLGRDDARMTLTQGGIELPETKASFTAAGVALDWNGVVAQSEYTVARSFGVATKAWYAMAGYRFGKVLPFASHGKLTGSAAQSTDSIGVRWDAFRSAEIKFQVDRVKPEGTGLFNAARPGFRGPVTVGAVAVDFVF